MHTLKRKETKMDMSKLLSDKKRTLEWSSEDAASMDEACKDRKSNQKSMHTWEYNEEHPSFVKAITRIAKNSFGITDQETKGVNVTVFTPPSKDMSGQQLHVPQAFIATACRVVISAGSKEFLDISICNPKKEGEILATETLMVAKDQMIMFPFGAASGVTIDFDNATSVSTQLRPNFRKTRVHKEPSKRYIIVLDFIMDPSCIVDMITKFTKSQRLTPERTEALQKEIESAIASL